MLRRGKIIIIIITSYFYFLIERYTNFSRKIVKQKKKLSCFHCYVLEKQKECEAHMLKTNYKVKGVVKMTKKEALYMHYIASVSNTQFRNTS